MPPLTTLSETGLNDDNVTFAANQSQVARLDTQHGAIHSAMPHLVLAPIDLAAGGHRILDHPTGSGAYSRPADRIDTDVPRYMGCATCAPQPPEATPTRGWEPILKTGSSPPIMRRICRFTTSP
jgi:hypothetical protein